MTFFALMAFAVADVILSISLKKFVFVDLQRAWQFWGAFLYAVFLSGLYLELPGGEGLVPFELGESYSLGYWVLVAYSLGMVACHMWASGLFDST